MLYGIIALMMFLLFPNHVVDGALQGLRLCGGAVIPSLFPFMVATKMLTATMPRSSNPFTALLISFLGGYPVGVCTVTSLYENGKLSKKDAEQALLYCNNSGPGFFVGMLGATVLCSVKMGLILYAIHVMSAFVCRAIFFQKPSCYKIKRAEKASVSFSQNFLNAINTSCTAILQVSALVVFFCVLSSVIHATKIFSALPSDVEALLCGVLELTSGTARLTGSEHAFVLCSFLMGWGGFCVHMQAMSLWHACGLNPRGYFISKLLQGILSAAFAVIFVSRSKICLVGGSIGLIFCLIFPIIRQKWGRKTRNVVV